MSQHTVTKTMPSQLRAPVLPTRLPSAAVLPADRSFKVLQHSRTPAQLSLFPPPGLVARSSR